MGAWLNSVVSGTISKPDAGTPEATIATSSTGYLPRVLSGRLSSGAERGHGRLFHAVKNGEAWGTAACGAKPGRRSGSGFVLPESKHQTITCERCRRKLGLD